MSQITDWIMVFITLIYVIATIMIYRANKRSVETMKEQISESRRQFDESQRLSAMPYLQVKIEDGKVDENGLPLCPYMTYAVTESNDDNEMSVLLYISFVNEGLGLMHHTKIKWNSLCDKDGEYPVEDVVIPPHVEYGINTLFSSKRPDTDDMLKPIIARCSFEIQYEDLHGIKYEQIVKIIFVVHYSEMHVMHYFITSPKRMDI